MCFAPKLPQLKILLGNGIYIIAPYIRGLDVITFILFNLAADKKGTKDFLKESSEYSSISCHFSANISGINMLHGAIT